MKRLVRGFAKWLLKAVGAGHHIFIVPDGIANMVPEAIRIVMSVEEHSSPHMSGEFKRSKVFGSMVKAFPKARKSECALALEFAVRALGI